MGRSTRTGRQRKSGASSSPWWSHPPTQWYYTMYRMKFKTSLYSRASVVHCFVNFVRKWYRKLVLYYHSSNVLIKLNKYDLFVQSLTDKHKRRKRKIAMVLGVMNRNKYRAPMTPVKRRANWVLPVVRSPTSTVYVAKTNNNSNQLQILVVDEEKRK